MEVFMLYGVVSVFGNPLYAEYFGFKKADAWLLWTIVLAACAVIWVFKGIGLYTMAKKQGKSKLLCLCGCVPFASTYLIGELAGEFRLGRTKVKHIGLYAMLAELVLFAAQAMVDISESFLFMNETMYAVTPVEQGTVVVLTLEFTDAAPQALITAMNIFSVFSDIFYFVWLIAHIFLCMAFFRVYAPANHVWMVVVCALFPGATGFFAFAFRNRTPVDYDKFIQQRMEQLRRAQQAQYGPYGNPYGGNPYGQNGQNPYGQNPYGSGPYGNGPYGNGPYGNGPYGNGPYGRPEPPAAPKQPDDPFGEYSSKPSSGGDPFGEFSGKQGGPSDGPENKGSGGQGGDGSSDDYFS